MKIGIFILGMMVGSLICGFFLWEGNVEDANPKNNQLNSEKKIQALTKQLKKAQEELAQLQSKNLQLNEEHASSPSLKKDLKLTHASSDLSKQKKWNEAKFLSLKLLLALDETQSEKLRQLLINPNVTEVQLDNALQGILTAEQFDKYQDHQESIETSYKSAMANQKLMEIETLLLLEEEDKNSLFKFIYENIDNLEGSEVKGVDAKVKILSSQLSEEQIEIYRKYLESK